MGERDFDLFTLFVYFTQLLPCGGPVWLKRQGTKLGYMVGKRNWFEWQGEKNSSRDW